jgi:transglutaminase-like putative cysteine protease
VFLVSLALVFVVVTATVFHTNSWHGLPTPGTFSNMREALRQSWQDFSATQAPVFPTSGFKLLAAGGAGVVAITGDWIAFRRRAVLPAVVPAFAMFVVCCTAGQGEGRGLTATTEVVALSAFLLAKATGEREMSIWLGADRRGAASWAVRTGLPMAALGVVICLLVAPLATGPDGHGLLGWRGHGSERVVDDPTVDMETQLLDPSDQPMFTIETQYPSYWRLTTLATFTGQLWTSSGTYHSFGSKLPGASAAPAGTQIVQNNFQIQELDSPWLPDSFNPVSVQGVEGVTYDPVSDSLITKNRTTSTFAYDVTSYRFLAGLTRSDLESAPPVTGSTLRTYTALPSSVPEQVRSLAQTITANQTTEFDKAMAIQQYLLSPPFSYSLHPAVDGSGNQALENFLFVTHQGYCQQFAGAYAVLARAAGLPTRVAVGFAEGTFIGGGSYQIAEQDAHSWPEIYFGPHFGWVPFEPTPTYSDPESSGYDTTRPGGKAGAKGSPTSGTSPTSATATTLPVGGGHTPTVKTLPAPAGAFSGPRKASGVNRFAAGAGVALALLALWIPVNLSIRRVRWRLRRRRAASRGPAGLVLASWADVSEMLAWRGITRHPSETFAEFAKRAGRANALKSAGNPGLADGVSRLAVLAEGAAFAPAVDGAVAHTASEVSGRIRHGLLRSARASQLLSWVLLPRPGPRVV